MADGQQAATFQDDELDFRPAKPAVRPEAGTASGDGLDFQPTNQSKIGTPDVVGKYVREHGVSIGEARRQLRGHGYDLKSFENATAAAQPPVTPRQQASSDEIDFQPSSLWRNRFLLSAGTYI